MRNSTASPFFLPIASLTIELNTMRWPSTARMRSPALKPAASEGDPACSEATLGLTSGSTPMVPTSNRALPRVRNSVRSGRILSRSSRPSRITTASTSRSGRAATAMSRCSQVRMSAVPSLTITSPGRMPARSAGEPGCTAPTVAGRSRYASTSAPCIRTTASRITARIRFMTGPASRIWNRCHFDFDRNSSFAPVFGSSGFSPAIFT